MIKVGNKDVYKITGIAEDPPANSDIRFNVLLSFSTLYSLPGYYMDWNGGNQYYTFLELNNIPSVKSVESRLPAFTWERINKKLAPYKIEYKPYLQPLGDIHLKYNETNEAGLSNIYIFSAVALLIILIACINFINLSIARASKRLKEIGVRKILGAGRKNLFTQFISEYLIISTFVLVIVLVLIEILSPYYGNVVGENIGLVNPFDPLNILLVFAVIFIVGAVAGGYPALYLSGVKPVNSLKGEVTQGENKNRSKNILLVVQFAISVGMIICTLLISEQLNYINNKDLGFNKENIITVRLFNDETKVNLDTFRQRLETVPGVISSAGSSEIPCNGFTSNGYIPEGFNSPVMINVLDAGSDFVKTYGIKMAAGRNFIPGMASDSSAYLINESLAKQFGWKNPVGKIISRNGKHRVIGVVKDFNYNSLYSGIGPLIITEKPYRDRFDFVSIKVSPAGLQNTIAGISAEWKNVNPSAAFEFTFLDSGIRELYSAEQRFREIFFTFSILAILLALLGLFSLSSLTTELKTKEIGIRKVLGDTAAGITVRILKEYMLLVIIADVFGSLAAYYFINKWLNDFAFHISPSAGVFILSAVLTIFTGVGVVVYHAVKAANNNPVKALRYE